MCSRQFQQRSCSEAVPNILTTGFDCSLAVYPGFRIGSPVLLSALRLV